MLLITAIRGRSKFATGNINGTSYQAITACIEKWPGAGSWRSPDPHSNKPHPSHGLLHSRVGTQHFYLCPFRRLPG